ncbi:MAG: hypothetical protein DI609_00820 [Corynebacterium urealyticum]|uniref:Uncharacterized protein n=1 Tax=Corynebacterium urealyticum TaxID=43771 RepID=A0A2W5BE87_9CORY|nr:MAG: hypothetical protein DI609_00820 [Corynebacterium urealyticum]
MSTPVNLNIVMPYGATMLPDSALKEWSMRDKTGAMDIPVPDGPCRIAASWAGKTPVQLIVVNGGSSVTLADIPGGQAIKAHGGRAGDQARLRFTRNPVAADLKYTGTIEVYPLNFE